MLYLWNWRLLNIRFPKAQGHICEYWKYSLIHQLNPWFGYYSHSNCLNLGQSTPYQGSSNFQNRPTTGRWSWWGRCISRDWIGVTRALRSTRRRHVKQTLFNSSLLPSNVWCRVFFVDRFGSLALTLATAYHKVLPTDVWVCHSVQMFQTKLVNPQPADVLMCHIVRPPDRLPPTGTCSWPTGNPNTTTVTSRLACSTISNLLPNLLLF